MNLDFYLFQKFNNFAGKNLFLDTAAVFFGQYFGYILVFFLILFLLKNFKKNLQMVLEALFGAMLAKEIFVDIIRQILPRARPFIENDIYLLIDHTASSSFPSAHTAFYFAIATTIYLHDKKMAPFFIFGALLISIARVFSGVHWPSDILAGALIGIFSALTVNRIAKEFPQK
jgi:undecaprenyl-diphosphatase